MPKHDKISHWLLISFVLFSFFSTSAQDTPSPPSQNVHQWGAVTLFNGLPSDKVRAIAQTQDGVIWFGTDNGLARFDGRRIQTINLTGGEAQKIFVLETSDDGTLWIGTQNGLTRYKDGKFQRIAETENFAIRAILIAENILLATDNGQILKLRQNAENNFTIEKIPEQILSGNDNQPLKITGLAQLDNSIIAGTRSRSVLLLENNQTFEIFSRPRPFFVNSLAKDKEGKLWLGADSESKGSGIYLVEDIARPQRIGEATGNVLAMHNDGRDGVWIGTEANGLFHFRRSEQLEHFTFENTAGGLRSNTIYALYVDREGVTWIGTDRGICRFDASSPFNKTVSENSNSNFVRTIFKTRDGQLLAGTNRGLFSSVNGNWIENSKFSQKIVYEIAEDLTGQLLIGTSAGLLDLDGKPKLPGEARAIVNFQGKTYAAVFGSGVFQLDSQAQIFKDDSPTTLYADEQNLWIGTAQNGVFRFNGKETKQEDALADLRGAAIRTITKDADNNIWFASDEGLFLYKENRLETIIANQLVRDVVVSGADIWTATEGSGILHVKRDERFGWMKVSLNVEQGLPSQKVFSILPLENRLLIGTNRGVVTYQPITIQPKIVATRILSQRLYETENLDQTLALSYPQNSLLVEVAGLSSRTFPEQFQYGFLLLNAKDEILDKKLSNEAQFAPANLAPGEYRIEARAFNKDLLSSEPLVIKFSIARAPFPRAAAALGALLTIAVIALIWAMIERRRITQRNRQLAAARFDLASEAERERKRIARDLHDQTLADLRNLMLMSDKLPADTSEFRSEVESISTEIRRICEDLSPSVLENVGFVAALEFLLKHTTQNSEFFADDDAEQKLSFSVNVQMQIYRIAQEVLTNIKHHSDAKFVEMKIDISDAGEFVLSIRDDGTNFDPSQKTQKGRGIANIKSRAALIRAEVAWKEAENGGTIFNLTKKI